MNNTNDVNLRNLALRIVEDIYKNNVFIGYAVDNHLSDYELDKQSRAFIKRLVYGTVENTILIDYIINQSSKTKTKKMKNIILYILRLSVYQIMYMDSVPDSAVCNEGVKLAKKRKFHQLTGFVNGVLRNVSRTKDDIAFPDEETNQVDYLSVMFSTPKWLVVYLFEQYDYVEVKRILEASTSQSNIMIRHNQLKCTFEELKTSLTESKVGFEVGSILPYALKITSIDRLSGLEAFERGYFQVQDESSMLVTEVIQPKEDSLIIDLCAAPGGKTTHLASFMNNTGQVISKDLSEKKLVKIEENCNRLGLSNVMISEGDAILLDNILIEKADVVLADVPCSGLGIIKKKPDIKYNVSKEGIEELIEIQKRIISNAANYVKEGGILVYSTCTVNKNENDKNVEWFLKEHSEFSLEEIKLDYQIDNKSEKGYISLLPEVDGPDGFFIAKLKKGCLNE